MLAAGWILLTGSVASAATQALLIGVSDYPGLNGAHRLAGPRNDVRNMAGALSSLGLRATDITILADGVTRPATRAAILGELDRLLARSREGDWLILYFSGHGSQQPQIGNGNGHVEPDGLDEIFLPHDATGWNGHAGRVGNAISDDELGRFIDAAGARNVNVWGIFDTCHAEGMSRALAASGAGGQSRRIAPELLGIPAHLLKKARAVPARRGWMPRHPARSVMFYAARSDEEAPEENLATPFATAGSPKLRQGVFTWHLAQSLRYWQGSFDVLARRLVQAYRRENRPFPTPSFEGALEAIPLFSGIPDAGPSSASTRMQSGKAP